MTEYATAGAAASGTLDLGDISVRRLGFGTMRLTGEGIWGPLERSKRDDVRLWPHGPLPRDDLSHTRRTARGGIS